MLAAISNLFQPKGKRPMATPLRDGETASYRPDIRGTRNGRQDPAAELTEALSRLPPPGSHEFQDEPIPEAPPQRNHSAQQSERRPYDYPGVTGLTAALADKPAQARGLMAQFTFGEMIEAVSAIMATRPRLGVDDNTRQAFQDALPFMLFEYASGKAIGGKSIEVPEG
jgi:hypothetical protein